MYTSILSEVYLEGNTSFASNLADFGGALSTFNSTVHMTGNTDFSGNVASSDAGAMYASKSSAIHMDGNVQFSLNAAERGGAIMAYSSNFSIATNTIRARNLSGEEGELDVKTGSDATFGNCITFIDNMASKAGGAMYIIGTDHFQVNYTTFRSNNADLGGAIYIASTDGKATGFSQCTFEGNTASDGGALYLYTGAGVDTITASIFRNNSASAIFHTGSLRLNSVSFSANAAGAEGTAVFSIGLLEELANVVFSHNSYICPVGQYGYIVKQDEKPCGPCLDQVCTRCSGEEDDLLNTRAVDVDGLSVCAAAPPGSTTSSSGTTMETLTLRQGYYRTSNQSHVVLECYRKEACDRGNDAANYCASGYKGAYCAVCETGFAPGIAYSCNKCSPGARRSTVGVAASVASAALLITALLSSYLGRVVEDRGGDDLDVARGCREHKCFDWQNFVVEMLPLTAIKIVVTVWQIISQFTAIAGNVYPEGYTNFVGKLTPINFDIGLFLSYSCMVSTDFYDRLVISTVTPLLMLLALAASYFVGKKRNHGSESAIQRVRHRHQSAAFFLLFLIYSSVSYTIFQTFACDDLDDGQSYLRADYSLECSTSRHNTYKAYARGMACVYPVGIPLVFTWCLAHHRHDLVKPDREEMPHLEPMNSIWAAYRPTRYYFEVVECGRRISLTAIAAFVLPNSTAQVSIVLLFAVVFVFISEAMSPFKESVNMGLYRWGNGIIVASLYVAFLIKIDIDTPQSSSAFSSVLVAANVFMAVVVAVEIVLLMVGWYRANQAMHPGEIPANPARLFGLDHQGSLSEGGTPRGVRRGGIDPVSLETRRMRRLSRHWIIRPSEICLQSESTHGLHGCEELEVDCSRCNSILPRAQSW